MAISDQLGMLSPDVVVSGRNTLHRVFIHGATVSDNVAAVNLSAIKAVEADPVSYDRSEKLYQQGGGDDALQYDIGQSHGVRITVYAGQLPTFLSALMGTTTFGPSGYSAQNLTFDALARFDVESVYRKKDNATHLFSVIHQDLVIQPFALNSPMEDVDVVIPAISYHDPIVLASGAEAVYSQYNGDGSTTTFTLPATPLSLRDLNVGNADDWVLEKLIYCKVKLSTDDQGSRQKSGISISGTSLTFTTAPAAGSRVQVLFAKATA